MLTRNRRQWLFVLLAVAGTVFDYYLIVLAQVRDSEYAMLLVLGVLFGQASLIVVCSSMARRGSPHLFAWTYALTATMIFAVIQGSGDKPFVKEIVITVLTSMALGMVAVWLPNRWIARRSGWELSIASLRDDAPRMQFRLLDLLLWTFLVAATLAAGRLVLPVAWWEDVANEPTQLLLIGMWCWPNFVMGPIIVRLAFAERTTVRAAALLGIPLIAAGILPVQFLFEMYLETGAQTFEFVEFLFPLNLAHGYTVIAVALLLRAVGVRIDSNARRPGDDAAATL